MNFDDIVFDAGASSRLSACDDAVWSAVVGHVVAQLSSTLGQDIQLIGDQDIKFDEGFSVDFRSKGVGSNSWKIRLRGVIGADVVDGALLVRAWVFIYLNNVRLSVEGQGHVSLMRYVKTDGGGVWEPDGWEYGEHGEWDPFAHFDEG